MTPEPDGARRVGRILTMFLIAVAVNALLFGLVAWNAREVPIRADMTTPRGESGDPAASGTGTTARNAAPQAPAPEPELDFTPELRPPAFGELDAGITFTIDLDLGAFEADSGLGSVVFQAHELDKVPQVLMRIPPVYPPRAQLRGIEGVVKVQLLINVDARSATCASWNPLHRRRSTKPSKQRFHAGNSAPESWRGSP